MIQHIPEDHNVMTDSLTRVSRTSLMEIPKHKSHLFVDDSIERIFRLGEEELEETDGELQEEGESGGEEDYDAYRNVEMHEVFSRYHNSIVGHLSVERTLKAMSLGGHAFGMLQIVPDGSVSVVSAEYVRALIQ